MEDHIMISALCKARVNPIICSTNNIVTQVNVEFINLTGYTEDNLIGNSLSSICSMLNIHNQIYLESMERELRCYIFTKEYEPREITISCKSLNCDNEKIYQFKEYPNSRIEDKIPYVASILSDNQKGIAIYSSLHRILLKANKKYLDFLSIPHDELKDILGNNAELRSSNHIFAKVEDLFIKVVQTKDTYYEKEVEIIYYNGKITYWDISVVPIYIESEIKYLVYSVDDVTEKVINRKLVEEQNKEVGFILENISGELVYINKYGDYIKKNKRAKDNPLADYSTVKNNRDAYNKAEYYEMDGTLILFENTPVQRLIRGEKISRHMFIAKNNNVVAYIEVTGTPFYDKAGSFTGGVLIYNHVTERIKKEEHILLETQYELLKRIIENLELSFARFTYTDYKITSINNKAYNILKQINEKAVSYSTIIGETYFSLFNLNLYEIDELKINIQRLIEKKVPSYFKYRTLIVEGEEEKYYKVMYQPIIGFNDKVVEVIAIATDVTEEINAKNQLEKNLKNKEEIFVNLSHDLKTPLNVVFSASQLIELYLRNDSLTESKESILRYDSMIKQNCYRLTKLINNIVDISKLDSGYLELKLSNENIVQVIEEIVQSVSEFIKEKGLSITFDTNTEEKIISCDPNKIERIILNLISNSIKFTNPGGTIFVGIIDKGSNVEISVEDTGIGIDKEHLDNIFERFRQVEKSLSRNTGGSGIGLSLVKSIVELHGGEISVESKPNVGSNFKIVLPARIVENPKVIEKSNAANNRINMINLEFSDLYSNGY